MHAERRGRAGSMGRAGQIVVQYLPKSLITHVTVKGHRNRMCNNLNIDRAVEREVAKAKLSAVVRRMLLNVAKDEGL